MPFYARSRRCRGEHEQTRETKEVCPINVEYAIDMLNANDLQS